MLQFDCENIVNYDECCLYHIVCNGCMDCEDYKPKQTDNTLDKGGDFCDNN